MSKLKCTKDETGFWTEGETYAADDAGAGMLSVGDDDYPNSEWIAHHLTYSDDDSVATYHIPGLDGSVEFEEVA
ncbi:hypothetical protein ABQ359_22200 [Serratia fonticola]|uniref:hypothetical protein n=1 Tax=Serratia fonticola TaxID=47917 RepID=UPI003AAAAAE1